MRSKKAIMNIIASLLVQVVALICGFVIPKLTLERFGSSTYGLIGSINQFLMYITLLDSGFGAVVKSILYKPIANKNKNEIEDILKASEKFLRKLSCIFIVYIIVLCVVYPHIANTPFDYLYTVSLIIILSISTFSEYFFGMSYKLYLQAEQKTYVPAIIQLFTTILNTIIVIVLIKTGFSIHIVKLSTALTFILRPLIQNYYVKKKYNINLRKIKSNYEIKQKWDGFAQHVATVIHNNTDIVVLTIFSTMKEIAVYSVYMLVINGVKSIIQAFSNGIDSSFGDMIARNEKENLNNKFKHYSLFYYTIVTIVFSCTASLILPFVSLYTSSITDANYYRPLFSYIIVMSEFVWSIRVPFNMLVLAGGKFKETKRSAWIEAGLNIAVSILLVWKFGIIGVAIGTLIAMIYRTIYLITYATKEILKNSITESYKLILIIIIQLFISIIIINLISNFIIINSYIKWLGVAIVALIVSSLVTITINLIFYKKYILEILKKFIKSRNVE